MPTWAFPHADLQCHQGLVHQVPLIKLLELDSDVQPYLAMLMVAALVCTYGTLMIPDTTAAQVCQHGSLQKHIVSGGREGI